MEKKSKSVIKYKSLTSLMFLFYAIHPINLYGMFTRSTMPARFRPNITPAQRAIIATAEKEAEEDRKAEEENLERIRLKDLKLQQEAQERGEKRYQEILQEGRRAQSLKSIKVQASDGVTTIPLSIAKRSVTLTSMFSDVGVKDPIPLPQYSLSVIRDVCNIIPQRFINPEKVEKRIEQYSLQQLVERFDFVHYLNFPQDIQNLFKQKIIQITQGMSFQRAIENKDAIKMIDSDIPEFKLLTKMANTPYVGITNGQYKMFYIPEQIYTMSEYLLGALRYNQKREISLDENLMASLLEITEIINRSKENSNSIHRVMEYMGYDSIRQIIPIINCLDYLGFSDAMQREFGKELYLLSKKVPFNQLVQQLEILNNPKIIAQVFVNPIVDKLKSCLLEKALTMDDRKTVLEEDYYVAFSPNNKMFATGYSNQLQLRKFNSDGTIDLLRKLFFMQNSRNPIRSIVFSSDSKKLAVGIEERNYISRDNYIYKNNILLYDVGDDGIIDKDPLILDGHQDSGEREGLYDVYNIAFSPNDDLLISAKSRSIGTNLLAWNLSKNGPIATEPRVLIANEKVKSKVHFNDDGTISIVSENIESPSLMILWTFNKDFTVKSKLNLEKGAETNKIIFCSHEKKLVTKHDDYYGNKHHALYMYDFSDPDNIISHQIVSDPSSIILLNIFNDRTVIFRRYPYSSSQLCFFDVSDLKKDFKCDAKVTTKSFTVHFRPDGKKMIFPSSDNNPIYANQAILYTILTDEEEQKINNLKTLDGYQLVLIDKMLSGATDLPSLEDYEVPQSTIDLLKSVKLVP